MAGFSDPNSYGCRAPLTRETVVKSECILKETTARFKIVPLLSHLSTVAFVCDVFCPTEACTEFVGCFNIIFCLSRSNLLVYLFETQGEINIQQVENLRSVAVERERVLKDNEKSWVTRIEQYADDVA
jgi:hypothetical protein